MNTNIVVCVCFRYEDNGIKGVQTHVQPVLNLLCLCPTRLNLSHETVQSGRDLLGAYVSILDHVILEREHILLEGQD